MLPDLCTGIIFGLFKTDFHKIIYFKSFLYAWHSGLTVAYCKENLPQLKLVAVIIHDYKNKDWITII